MQDQEGRSRRDRLESRLERAIRKGRTDVAAEIEAELATPPFPAEVAHIWTAWVRLRRRKAPGMQGQEPIGWVDIDAFMRRSGVRLTADEVELLEVIDDAYLTSFSAEPSAAEQKLALRDSLERVSKPRER